MSVDLGEGSNEGVILSWKQESESTIQNEPGNGRMCVR